MSLTKRILVDYSVLHDQGEVLFRLIEEVEVLERIAIDRQEIRIGAFFDRSEFARVGIARSGHGQQFRVVRRGLLEDFHGGESNGCM